MTDYMPDPNRNDPNKQSNHDRYGNAQYNRESADTGKGPYILLGLLVAIGLVGGLLYFNGTPRDSSNTAQMPATTQSAPAPAPAPQRTPMPAAPAQPATPPATQR